MRTFLFFMVLVWGSVSLAAEPVRLMIVHSYGKDNPTAIPQEQGALHALRKAGWVEGQNLRVSRFFMDTKRHYITPQQIAERGRMARARIKPFQPDVLLTIDDNAFQQVGVHYLNTALPVVFTGLNYPVSYYQQRYALFDGWQPRHNITGVFERLPLERSLDILGLVRHLSAQDEVVILVDGSPTGQGLFLSAKEVLQRYHPAFQVRLVVVDTVAQFQQVLRQLNAQPKVKGIYLGTLRLRQSQGPAWNATDIVRWTVANSRLPEMTLSYSLVRAGCFGGVALDMHAMGAQAGKMVAALLRDVPVSLLSYEQAQHYGIVFNYHRAQALGMEIPPSLLWAADQVF